MTDFAHSADGLNEHTAARMAIAATHSASVDRDETLALLRERYARMERQGEEWGGLLLNKRQLRGIIDAMGDVG